jgi:Holliday junction resolvase RusA-like endonuclease
VVISRARPAKIVVRVPMVPAAELSPNARPHPQAKAKYTRQLRQAAQFAAVSARNTCGGGPILRGAIHVYPTIGWPKARRYMDGDNALSSLKAVWDGFTDAHLWTDDRYAIFHPVEQVRDPENLGFVEVTLALEPLP